MGNEPEKKFADLVLSAACQNEAKPPLLIRWISPKPPHRKMENVNKGERTQFPQFQFFPIQTHTVKNRGCLLILTQLML